uniref:Rho guanine nucleotide exchange factor (GEF) 3 n=1 Tax=Gadus morhua TaxID=8049 RepID=A0A8C5AEU1_GADMO
MIDSLTNDLTCVCVCVCVRVRVYLWVCQQKKRKQQREVDSLSLCSLDINEPSTKRTRSISKVSSLINLLPPVKTAPLKRIGQTLQVRTRPLATGAAASSSKRRDSKLWSETFDTGHGTPQMLSPQDIRRQEAIFELAQGEQDLVEDLHLARKAYHDPMLKLSIMTEQELNQIFGTLNSLIPLHEDLLCQLRDARNPDGSTELVGPILTHWLPCLRQYTGYCSKQLAAKSLLDRRKQDPRVEDFLLRCLQSPFSRKLDLWNFLDIPRSRLVKYPLLLREIQKHTANEHPDKPYLDQAVSMVQGLLSDINQRTGEAECQYFKERLVYGQKSWRDGMVECSTTLCCHGELKNTRGVKLHVFLFQDALVITRSSSLNDQPISYQLCHQPIPIQQLVLEDLQDGEMRVGGSIRGAFSNNERSKNFLRLSSPRGQQSHCLQASDAFNKQQWINCIRLAKEAAVLDVEPLEAGPSAKAGAEPIEDIKAAAELEGVDYGSREEKQEEEEEESCEERERRVGAGISSSSHSEEEMMEEDHAPLQEEAGQASDYPEKHAPQLIRRGLSCDDVAG